MGQKNLIIDTIGIFSIKGLRFNGISVMDTLMY